jgi:hypothetical protein
MNGKPTIIYIYIFILLAILAFGLAACNLTVKSTATLVPSTATASPAAVPTAATASPSAMVTASQSAAQATLPAIASLTNTPIAVSSPIFLPTNTKKPVLQPSTPTNVPFHITLVPIRPIIPIIPILIPTNTVAWQCGIFKYEIGCTSSANHGYCVWIGSSPDNGICKRK